MMPDHPDPIAGELLAEADLILAQTFVTTGPMGNLSPAAHWRRNYRRWLARQNHPANQGGAA